MSQQQLPLRLIYIKISNHCPLKKKLKEKVMVTHANDLHLNTNYGSYTHTFSSYQWHCFIKVLFISIKSLKNFIVEVIPFIWAILNLVMFMGYGQWPHNIPLVALPSSYSLNTSLTTGIFSMMAKVNTKERLLISVHLEIWNPM